MKKKAFTLIELLVVISIIAVLMAVMMPALGKAREQAKTMVCKTNMKTLSTAWFMYSVDNKKLCEPAVAYSFDKTQQAYTWVRTSGYPGAEPMPAEANWYTQESYKIRQENISKGVLWSYINSYDAYGCPCDKKAKDRIRSYSINYTLNGLKQFETMYGSKVIKTMSEIKTPSSKIAFAAKYFPNDNAFEIRGPYRVIQNDSLLGNYAVPWHNGKSNFGFADGHAETIKWGKSQAENDVLRDRIVESVSAPDCEFLKWLKDATNVSGQKAWH